MKLTKYLLFACSALVLASCGNDENFNTANDVTVQMANAVQRTVENRKLFNVPIEVVGKANGPIRVTVEMTPASENPANENEHYLPTSKTVVIPDNETTVSIEFAPVNDRNINEDRVFIVSIKNAEGAKIGEQNSTEVIIRDDDGLPYEAIQGVWTFNAIDFFDGTNVTFDMSLEGVDDTNILYEHALYVSGWMGMSDLVAEIGYSYDEESGETTLDFTLGQTLGQVNFTGLGKCDVVLYGIIGGGLATQGALQAIVDPKLQTITFDPEEGIYLGVVSNGQYMGGWDGFTDVSMNRKEESQPEE